MQPMKWVYGVNRDIAGEVRTGSKHLARSRLGVAAFIVRGRWRAEGPGAHSL